MIIAVPEQSNDHRRSLKDYVLPTSFKITADSVVQRNLDSKSKITSSPTAAASASPATAATARTATPGATS